MNRGSEFFFGSSAGSKEASMRPRFMNRGSAAWKLVQQQPYDGFNEAPIHESGKCHPDPRPSPAWSCFNEAPIHESGKYAGSEGTRPDSGHRFNEAPIHESGKYVSIVSQDRYAMASMRPRFMNRGSEGGLRGQVASGHASMRPRFMNRGSPGGIDALIERVKASMRPRFMNRGSIASCRAAASTVALQ